MLLYCREVTDNDVFATGDAIKKYSVLAQMLEARVSAFILYFAPLQIPCHCHSSPPHPLPGTHLKSPFLYKRPLKRTSPQIGGFFAAATHAPS